VIEKTGSADSGSAQDLHVALRTRSLDDLRLDEKMRRLRGLHHIVRYHQPDRPDALFFPLLGSRFDTIFQKARRRAGLMRAATNDTPIRPLDLRSTYAMLAEEAGIEATVISRGGLGHTSAECALSPTRSEDAPARGQRPLGASAPDVVEPRFTLHQPQPRS